MIEVLGWKYIEWTQIGFVPRSELTEWHSGKISSGLVPRRPGPVFNQDSGWDCRHGCSPRATCAQSDDVITLVSGPLQTYTLRL